MELISTDDYFILQHLQRSETSLWVCRKTGKFSVRPPWDLCDQENPECLGLVWGIYGKLDIHPDVCQRLVLVKGKLKLPCFLIMIYVHFMIELNIPEYELVKFRKYRLQISRVIGDLWALFSLILSFVLYVSWRWFGNSKQERNCENTKLDVVSHFVF